MTNGQTIYFYIVKVVYVKPGRGKQKPVVFKQSGIHIISRAKNISQLNRDKKALEFAESQLRGVTKILNLRIYEITECKPIGVSAVHYEEDHANEFG